MLLSIDEANAWTERRALRKYQELLIHGLPFGLVHRGVTYNVERGVSEQLMNVLLLRSADRHWLLRSRGLGQGGELLSDITPLESPDIGTGLRSRLVAPWDQDETVLVQGHPNFAHFMWNELPAMMLLEQHKPGLKFVQRHNTMGLVSEFSPGLCPTPLSPARFRNSVTATSTFIDSETVQRVRTVSHCENVLRNDPNHPVIYLGVRGPGKRELLNEVEFYLAILARLAEEIPQALFMLDGFSFQRDNLHDEKARSRCQLVDERIRVITSALPSQVARQTTSINGLPLAEFFGRASEIAYYITHEGSMQHRIGWVWPQTRGMIMTPTRHAKSVANWHALQVDGSVAVDFLPANCVTALRSEDASSSRNIPFSVNISSAIEVVARTVTSALTQNSQHTARS